MTVERLPRDTIDGRSHCLTLTASRPRRCLKRFATGTCAREATGGEADQHVSKVGALGGGWGALPGAPRSERSRILDEFAAVTGYHRKHAIRLLSGAVRDVKVDSRSRGIAKPVTARRGVYGHEVRDALIQLWEVSDRICSKRLRPMVPVLLESLERHGQIGSGKILVCGRQPEH